VARVPATVPGHPPLCSILGTSVMVINRRVGYVVRGRRLAGSATAGARSTREIVGIIVSLQHGCVKKRSGLDTLEGAGPRF
jgi:hypothetical protein